MDQIEFEKRFPVPLNAQQREAVQALDGPALLLAVPGSGKTTVLVARLGYMIYVRGIRPENILTVTYTVAATQDMRRRFASFFGQDCAGRMEFRTINGICAKIILQYSRMIGRRPFQLVTDEKRTAAVLSQIYADLEGEWPTEGELRDVRGQITYIKNMMLTEEEIRAFAGSGTSAAGVGKMTGPGPGRLRAPSGSAGKLPEIYARYNRWLRDNRLMDYDDQMVYALTMLRRSPELLASLQDQYPYLCVDEAQDTSRIQHAILALLASRDRNLFMVGDEDQSIYGFRAAYPRALHDFEKNYPGARVLLMEENFRSTQNIVSLADRFIRRNTLRHEKSMRTSREEGAQVREIRLKGRRAQYTYLAKVAADCTGCAAAEGQTAQPPAEDPGRKKGPQTAVLYRNNESAVPLVDLLDREGIPFRIRNAEIGFFTHRTVMDIRAFMQLSLDPRDRDSFMRIYYKCSLYLRKEQAQRICAISRTFDIGVIDAALGNIPAVFTEKRPGKNSGKGPGNDSGGGRTADRTDNPSGEMQDRQNVPAWMLQSNPAGLHTRSFQSLRAFRTHLRLLKNERSDLAIERIVKDMGYGDYLEGKGLADSKIFILRTIGAGAMSPAVFLARLDQLYEIFANREQDPACPFLLSTIHASKGLEYDTVYLMDLVDGIFPERAPDAAGSICMSPAEREAWEEERRVFYVGITRARNRLHIFTTQEPSTFADELFGRTESGQGAAGEPHAGKTDTVFSNPSGRTAGGRRGVVRQESAYTELSRKKTVSEEELQQYILQLGQGLVVRHAKYGEGVVVKVDELEQKVRILFDDRARVFSLRTLCAGKLLEF